MTEISEHKEKIQKMYADYEEKYLNMSKDATELDDFFEEVAREIGIESESDVMDILAIIRDTKLEVNIKEE